MSPTQNTRSNNKSDDILLAAAKVIQTRGAARLTLDAVAKQAGISKGGLLYHYPSKEALLEGMLTSLLGRIDKRRQAAGDASTLTTMLDTIEFQAPEERSLSGALLAASAIQPSLLEPARVYLSELSSQVDTQSGEQELASILLLAIEGMRFLSLLELNDWSETKTQRVLAHMRKLADEVNS